MDYSGACAPLLAALDAVALAGFALGICHACSIYTQCTRQRTCIRSHMATAPHSIDGCPAINQEAGAAGAADRRSAPQLGCGHRHAVWHCRVPHQQRRYVRLSTPHRCRTSSRAQATSSRCCSLSYSPQNSHPPLDFRATSLLHFPHGCLHFCSSQPWCIPGKAFD